MPGARVGSVPPQMLTSSLCSPAIRGVLVPPGLPLGIAFTFNDRSHHPHATDAGHIADDVVELDVHALHRLLHVLYMAGSHADVVFAQPHVVLQPADLRRRNEPRAQQTMRMQLRYPLAVSHVRLAP